MSIDLDWYAVVTEAQREEVAQRALRQIGVATYIPTRRHEARRRGKLRETRRKVFPGYVFIGMQRDREPWLRIDSCSAVLGVLGFGTPSVPALIPAEEIGKMRVSEFFGRYDPDDRAKDAAVRVGRQARIKQPAADDPLALRRGRVIKVTSEERIWLLFGSGSIDTVVVRPLDELELV